MKIKASVVVEKDHDGWMVKIRTLHGAFIPVRGLTKEMAEEYVAPIRYAFIYGLEAAIRTFGDFGYNVD